MQGQDDAESSLACRVDKEANGRQITAMDPGARPSAQEACLRPSACVAVILCLSKFAVTIDCITNPSSL